MDCYASDRNVIYCTHTVYLEDGTLWQQFGKLDSGYILRFHQLADFHISSDGSHIDCFPFPPIETHTIRHLLLDLHIGVALPQARTSSKLVFAAGFVLTVLAGLMLW